MFATPRLLVLLLLGAVVVAGASFAAPLTWVGVLYFVALFGLLVADLILTPRPDQLTVKRTTEPKLSLGADNLVQIEIANRSARPVVFELRDEYPYQFQVDAAFLHGTMEALDHIELRYHVHPFAR